MSATAKVPRLLPLISTLLGAACLTSLAAGATTSWGRYRQALSAQEPRQEYGVFALNREVYAHARADLADLRIVDGAGGFVPLAFLPVPEVRPGRRPAFIFNQVFRADEAEVTVDLGPGAFLHDELFVELGGAMTYVARVAVEGSDDNRHWGTLAENLVLARLAGGGGSYVDLDHLAYPPCRFRYLRLRYHDQLNGARLHAIGAGCDAMPERQTLLSTWPAKMSTEISVDGQHQLLMLDLGCRLPVQELALRIKTPTFHRAVILEASQNGEVWERVTEEIIFRYEVAGAVIAQEELEFPTRRGGRFYRLRITKGDDEPLAIAGVEVRGRPDEVAFAAGGRDGFNLVYGVEEADPARYDLAALIDRLPPAAFARWSLSGAEERLGGNQPSWLLWLGLTVAVVILAGAVMLALRKMRTSAGE